MYFYFYDTIAQEKKHEVEIGKIETTLTDFGIHGRTEKLSLFKNARELIEDGIKNGAKTVVGIGDDETFSTLVNVVAGHPGVTLGFIPIVRDSYIAKLFGMPYGAEACTPISRRLTTTVDIGKIGDCYFVGSVAVSGDHTDLSLTCDGDYTVATQSEEDTVHIANLGNIFHEAAPQLFPGNDGFLRLVVGSRTKSGFLKKRIEQTHQSIFPVKELKLESRGDTVSLIADGMHTVNTPCAVRILHSHMNIISGRDRLLEG